MLPAFGEECGARRVGRLRGVESECDSTGPPGLARPVGSVVARATARWMQHWPFIAVHRCTPAVGLDHGHTRRDHRGRWQGRSAWRLGRASRTGSVGARTRNCVIAVSPESRSVSALARRSICRTDRGEAAGCTPGARDCRRAYLRRGGVVAHDRQQFGSAYVNSPPGCSLPSSGLIAAERGARVSDAGLSRRWVDDSWIDVAHGGGGRGRQMAALAGEGVVPARGYVHTGRRV